MRAVQAGDAKNVFSGKACDLEHALRHSDIYVESVTKWNRTLLGIRIAILPELARLGGPSLGEAQYASAGAKSASVVVGTAQSLCAGLSMDDVAYERECVNLNYARHAPPKPPAATANLNPALAF